MELSKTEIFRVGICRISILELGTRWEIGWNSYSGISWFSIPELVRDGMCFFGSGLRARVWFDFLYSGPIFPSPKSSDWAAIFSSISGISSTWIITYARGCYGGLCRVLFSCLKTEKKEHFHDRVNSSGKHLKGIVSLMLITTLEQTSGTRHFASALSRMEDKGTAWCHVGTADLRNMVACHVLMWGFHETGFRVTWPKREPLVSLLEKIGTFMTPLRDINRN